MNIKCPIYHTEIDIKKKWHNGGRDGYYQNWSCRCNNCGMFQMNLPADNYYQRQYYKTVDEVNGFLQTRINKYLVDTKNQEKRKWFIPR